MEDSNYSVVGTVAESSVAFSCSVFDAPTDQAVATDGDSVKQNQLQQSNQRLRNISSPTRDVDSDNVPSWILTISPNQKGSEQKDGNTNASRKHKGEEEEKKEELVTPKAKLQELLQIKTSTLVSAPTSTSPHKQTGVSKLPSPRSKLMLSSSPSLLSKLPSPSKQGDNSSKNSGGPTLNGLFFKTTTAATLSPTGKAFTYSPSPTRSPLLMTSISKNRPENDAVSPVDVNVKNQRVVESQQQEQQQPTMSTTNSETITDENETLPPSPPSLTVDSASATIAKSVKDVITTPAVANEVLDSLSTPSSIVAVSSLNMEQHSISPSIPVDTTKLASASASFQCLVPTSSECFLMRNDPDKKSVAWLDESCIPGKAATSMAQPWILELQTDDGSNEIIIECPLIGKDDRNITSFHVGGLQVISNARNVDVHIMENTTTSDKEFTYLMTCRGIPVKAVTSVVSSSPNATKTVSGFYKAMCVVPGGARSVSAVKLTFKSVSSTSRSLGADGHVPTKDNTSLEKEIARISSIRLTARIPAPAISPASSAAGRQMLSVPSGTQSVASSTNQPTPIAGLPSFSVASSTIQPTPIAGLPSFFSSSGRSLITATTASVNDTSRKEDLNVNAIASNTSLIVGLSTVIQQTEVRLQRGIGESKEAIEGKLLGTIQAQQSTIDTLNDKVSDMQKQLALITGLLQQKMERENERDRELEVVLARERERQQDREVAVQSRTSTSEQDLTTERKNENEYAQASNAVNEHRPTLQTNRKSSSPIGTRSRHSPQKLTMLLRMKEEVQTALFEAEEVVSGSHHQCMLSPSPNKAPNETQSPASQLKVSMHDKPEDGLVSENKVQTAEEEIVLDNKLQTACHVKPASAIDTTVSPSPPIQKQVDEEISPKESQVYECMGSEIVEVVSDEGTAEESKILATSSAHIPVSLSASGDTSVVVVSPSVTAPTDVRQSVEAPQSDTNVNVSFSSNDHQSKPALESVPKNEDVVTGSSHDFGTSKEKLILLEERRVEKMEEVEGAITSQDVTSYDNTLEGDKYGSNGGTTYTSSYYDELLTNASSIYDDDGNLRIVPTLSVADPVDVQAKNKGIAYEELEVTVKTFLALD